jgi:surfactin synthase thioesterase subunit/acyl carrier protein
MAERELARLAAAGVLPLAPEEGAAALVRAACNAEDAVLARFAPQALRAATAPPLVRAGTPGEGTAPGWASHAALREGEPAGTPSPGPSRFEAPLGVQRPGIASDPAGPGSSALAGHRLPEPPPPGLATPLAASARPEERHAAIVALLRQVIGQALRLPPERVPIEAPLAELGVDSLLAIELRTRIEAAFGERLPVTVLLGEPTVARIAAALGGGSASETPTASGAWLLPLRRVAGARATVVCFPYMGGSARTFAPWASLLRPGVSLLAVQLPGREEREAEAPATSLSAVGEAVARALKDEPGGLLFYGHSMGCLLAWATARALHAAGRPPDQLLLAAYPDPAAAWRLLAAAFRADTVLEQAKEAGFIPPVLAAVLAEDPGLARRVVADAHLATAEALPSDPLPTPLRVLAGAADRAVPPALAAGWLACSTAPRGLAELEGEHLFLDTHRGCVLAEVEAALREMLP